MNNFGNVMGILLYIAILGQENASTYYFFREGLKLQNPKVLMVEMCCADCYGYEV